MALETQTTYDYTFGSDAYLHYCSEHEVLRVADRSGDSVLLSNITEKQIDVFIKFYNKEEELTPQYQQLHKELYNAFITNETPVQKRGRPAKRQRTKKASSTEASKEES